MRRLRARDRRGDVAKLRIAIRMLPAFRRLDVALQAVAQVAEQLRHHGMTHPMARRLQRIRQRPRTLTALAQRRLGIARRRRLHHGVEVVEERDVDRRQGLAPAARSTDSRRRQRESRVRVPARPAESSTGRARWRASPARCRHAPRRAPRGAPSTGATVRSASAPAPCTRCGVWRRPRPHRSIAASKVQALIISYCLTSPYVGFLKDALSPADRGTHSSVKRDQPECRGSRDSRDSVGMPQTRDNQMVKRQGSVHLPR
jgi:hypothetical protein